MAKPEQFGPGYGGEGWSAAGTMSTKSREEALRVLKDYKPYEALVELDSNEVTALAKKLLRKHFGRRNQNLESDNR